MKKSPVIFVSLDGSAHNKKGPFSPLEAVLHCYENGKSPSDKDWGMIRDWIPDILILEEL